MAGMIETHENYAHDFDITLDEWRKTKPHGISGFFRFKNEEEFGRMSILTHLEWLDEIVILMNQSNDATKLMVDTLQKEFNTLRLHQMYKDLPEINVYQYPWQVHQIKTQEHSDAPENSVHSMVHYTNYGMSKCKYSWIAKIEGDVIGLSSFERIRKMVDEYPRVQMYYGRYGINLAGLDGQQFVYDIPSNAGWDEAVFNNDPDLYRCIKNGVWESIDFKDKPRKQMGFSFLHVKRCKKEHQGLRFEEDWRPFRKEIVSDALKKPAPDVIFENTGVRYAKL